MESLLGVHLHDYESKISSTVRKLNEVWEDLELEDSDRQDEVEKAMRAAESAWDASYDCGVQRKLKLQSQIEGMQREILGTQDQLGQPSTQFAYQVSESAHVLSSTFHETMQATPSEWLSASSAVYRGLDTPVQFWV